jgi:hypothetical protein
LLSNLFALLQMHDIASTRYLELVFTGSIRRFFR